ncbi:4Fe-4S dicluster domain-containing protein [Anaerobacillus alkaliphilus]|uniref:4Fe-4S dicluster domain-containing protein n=1 Tax=Anaerobacillus alkaliphilus TaxID=1548597 RepID=A0A4Q0VXX7_9BACI|nr:4Fe-4S dicluster domain-containing protein [Anaerobacillus alkaliphilus]RXJ04036.1 4Fe-4S dicluster domain-containing protein [Anaerobacillus alkaliphilus]
MIEKMNRRQYLKENFRSSFQFLGAVIGATIEQERNFIRPPGAGGNELLFLATCNRCGACADVCPTKTIGLFSVDYGAKLAGTPFINPNESPCTFCNQCISHCPTGALEKIGPKEKLGVAEIFEFNCLAHKGTMCDYCIRACPFGRNALSLVDGKPKVTEENCNGCGLCVAACIQTYKGIYVKALET